MFLILGSFIFGGLLKASLLKQREEAWDLDAANILMFYGVLALLWVLVPSLSINSLLLLLGSSSITSSVINPRLYSYLTNRGSKALISSWFPLISFSFVTLSAIIPNFLSSLVIIAQFACLFWFVSASLRLPRIGSSGWNLSCISVADSIFSCAASIVFLLIPTISLPTSAPC